MIKKNRTHIYDDSGNARYVVLLKNKIDSNESPPFSPLVNSDDDGHNHSNDHAFGNECNWKVYLSCHLSALVLLISVDC